MERRVEVEKKERYGQALREQMALNAEARRGRGDSEPPDTPFGSASSSRGFHDAHFGGDEPAGDVSLGPASMLHSGAPPLPPGPGPNHRHVASPARSQLTTPMTCSSGDWGTADKVAQVQDLMRQRISAVQEEQQRQWQRVQALLQEQAGAAAQQAEGLVQRQLEAARAAHAEELRRALQELSAAQRESAAQAERSEGLGRELSALRQAVERLQAEGDDCRGRLQRHDVDLDDLRHAEQENARFRADFQRSQREQDEEIARCRAELRDLAQQQREALDRLERQASDLERLRAERREDARAQAELAQEQRAVHEALGKVRAELQDLAGRVAGLPGQLKRLRDEMPRLAARAAQEALEGMRLPEPRALTPPPCAPEVSEEAYAVFRNGADEFHELPDIRNLVGRATTCNVIIASSQQISNKHASVDFNSEGRACIKDLGSRNGTFLNDRRVPQDAGLVLQSGDSVRLGADGPTYVFEFGPAYYARWPREPERVQDRRSAGTARGQRARFP